MSIAIVSILVLTGLVWLANKVLPFQICPICAAVSGTWLWLTAASLFGFVPAATYQPLILLLMGGTVVGIAYQGERSFALARRWPLAWKIFVVGIGFPAAFWAAEGARPAMLAIEAVVLATLAYLFFLRQPEVIRAEDSKVRDLEEKLKNCC